MTKPNTPEQLWSKVDQSGGSSACWPYTEGTSSPGWHGRMSVAGRMVIASRIAWELVYGPIPSGLYVLHACDNPPCCNPGHLMLGSTQANSVDAAHKGRMGKVKSQCKRGHPFEGNTYIHPQTGRRSCQACIALRDYARPDRHNNRRRLDVAGQALRTLASLDGTVFASDPKERPMLAQAVVRKLARIGLGEDA